MRIVLEEIRSAFELARNEERRQQMSGYMRGQFDYYGLVSPIRRELSKPFLKELPKEPKADLYLLIELLWQQPQREFHYIAQELFFKIAKNTLEKEDLAFIESLIIRNSWWDTIDFLAPKILKIYFDETMCMPYFLFVGWSFPGYVQYFLRVMRCFTYLCMISSV